MTIRYILCSFGTFFPVWVSCTKKNLATLYRMVNVVFSYVHKLLRMVAMVGVTASRPGANPTLFEFTATSPAL
jgi:hypothetical protein